MKFREGDKVKLNLETNKYKDYGIIPERHNNICTVTFSSEHSTMVVDEGYVWVVKNEMINLVNSQLLFDFMYEAV